MSNALKVRTNSDKAKSLLFKSIVGVRKAVKAVKTTTKAVCVETRNVSKEAWNADIS